MHVRFIFFIQKNNKIKLLILIIHKKINNNLRVVSKI